MNIGLFGFGCVGQGLWKVLEETKGFKADIKRICIKQADKPRPVPARFFTLNPADILDDPDIDVVVELIDDADAAFEIASQALKRGKSVVSANKKMIAHRMKELYQLQQQSQKSFLYEGACCGSIPIIRNLEEYYDNDLLTQVEGIFNSTSNVILCKIFDEQLSFDEALAFAQQHGFAESNPALDIEGFDAKFKLCILALHAFGVFVPPDIVFNRGINRINAFDIAFASGRDSVIKHISTCLKQQNKVKAYCMPRFVPLNHRYDSVKQEYNAVTLLSAFSEYQMFIGKGAGDKSTGSAVLSDLSALRYGYKYEYRKLGQNGAAFDVEDVQLNVYVRFYRDGDVPESDFTCISERYSSGNGNYWIGQISLSKLQQAQWIDLPGVNIIEL